VDKMDRIYLSSPKCTCKWIWVSSISSLVLSPKTGHMGPLYSLSVLLAPYSLRSCFGVLDKRHRITLYWNSHSL